MMTPDRAGFDTYTYNVGDEADRIEDSDAQGRSSFKVTVCWAERERSAANAAVTRGHGGGYRFGIYSHSMNRLSNILDRGQRARYIRLPFR